MTKRFAFLLLTAALGMAAAQTSTPLNNTETSVRNATADKNLTAARITVNTGSYVGPLSVLLSGVAKGAGYEVVFNFNVDALALINGEIVRANTPTTPSAGSTGSTATSGQPQNSSPIAYATPVGRPLELPAKPVTHVFNNVPFNEVWPLLMDVYELDYEVVRLGSVNVIRVGQRPRQLSITLSNITATQARDRATEFFGEEYYEEIETTVGDAVSKTKVFKGYRLPSTIRILADVENNRIIVGGSNEESDKVRSFISTIDVQRQVSTPLLQSQKIYSVNGTSSPVGALQLRYPSLQLTNIGDGGKVLISGPQTQIDEALNFLAIIDPPQSTGNLPNQTVQRVYAVKGAQADIVALLAAQYPGLKVTPVGQTGQLVITGPQNQLDAAVALLGQVDRVAPVVAGAQITQRVFQLVNASAEEVKATLEGTLARELTTSSIVPNATLIDPTTGQPYTTGALANAPLNPTSSATAATGTATADTKTATASIIADKRTNTLIVRGTADQVAQVADLIPNLDQRVPQINVQVRIQEVTETASRSLGMDWKAGFGGFTVSAGSGGLGAAFDPTRSLVGFNLGATLNTLQGQGLSKSVYDGAITMQSGQRSLGSGTSTQNASGSAAATIKSGGRLELNVPSTAANVAPIQKQIDYGVNLDFFDPQVAPDGTITMRVRGQINDLRTAITADTVPNLLQFVNSEAQTTLTFKNGETLLLSGLLKTTESTNRDGVPFLSSIPVIGGLFGREATKKEQTQLLVVITGNVVK